MITGLLERCWRWPRETLAERLSAACYGTVLVLVAIPVISPDDVLSGWGWELVSGIGVATWVAHLYAELVGEQVRSESRISRGEIGHAMVDGLPIPLAAVLPAIMLLLGRVELLDARVALWSAVAVAVGQLVGLGALIGGFASPRGVHVWSYAGATAVIGIAVVSIKVALGH